MIRNHLQLSAGKTPQRIPANRPPVFPGFAPLIWPQLLFLVTKAMSDRLLVGIKSSGLLIILLCFIA